MIVRTIPHVVGLYPRSTITFRQRIPHTTLNLRRAVQDLCPPIQSATAVEPMTTDHYQAACRTARRSAQLPFAAIGPLDSSRSCPVSFESLSCRGPAVVFGGAGFFVGGEVISKNLVRVYTPTFDWIDYQEDQVVDHCGKSTQMIYIRTTHPVLYQDLTLLSSQPYSIISTIVSSLFVP